MAAITDLNIRSGVYRDMVNRYALDNFGNDNALYMQFVGKLNTIYSVFVAVEKEKAEKKAKNGKH